MYNTLKCLENNNYNVAIYIRLSKEDVDKKIESQSIKNQRLLLESYIKVNGYKLYDIYIDDGYTGTNFDRPGFQRMINDIENKKINMVITKDLSRLGRDYIETGKYIEKIFPLKEVRYVALLDNIDTALDNSNNDIAPFKTVINDMYSRDNSKKIKSALKTMKLKGKWVGGCTPLGYAKDPKDKNHLIINKNESYIIEKIFDLASEGKSVYQIKEILIKEKIPTASMIRKKTLNTNLSSQGIWNAKTVYNILKNEMYIGNMVQNKSQRINYKIKKMVQNKKEKWIIIENTHDSIITKEKFKVAQKMLNSSIKVIKNKNLRLFDGFLYCYECKSKISICSPNKHNITYLTCNKYRMYSKLGYCTSHAFNYDKLEELILKELRNLIQSSLDYFYVFNKIKNIFENSRSTSEDKLKLNKINSEIENKKCVLDKMYIDKLENNIEKEMYERIYNKIIGEIKILKNEQKKLILKIKNKKIINCDKKYNYFSKEFFKMNFLTRNMILKIINKIEIHKDKNVDVYFYLVN